MKNLTRPLLVFALLLLYQGTSQAPAQAQTQFDLAGLAPGQSVLNLSISEETEVEQDTLVAVLEYSAQGRDKLDLQAEVNTAMAGALAMLENSEDIDYSTERYQVYMIRGEKLLSKAQWLARQRLNMRTMEADSLLEIAARLQEENFHIITLHYTLSREKQQEAYNALLKSALGKLQARADETAAILGKNQAALMEINLNDSFKGRYNGNIEEEFFITGSRVRDRTPEPVAAPGETLVSVNVSAKALLSP